MAKRNIQFPKKKKFTCGFKIFHFMTFDHYNKEIAVNDPVKLSRHYITKVQLLKMLQCNFNLREKQNKRKYSCTYVCLNELYLVILTLNDKVISISDWSNYTCIDPRCWLLEISEDHSGALWCYLLSMEGIESICRWGNNPM